MILTAMVRQDSDLYNALVKEAVTSFNFGENIFELVNGVYTCEEVIDLISLQEEPDMLIAGIGT